MNKNILTIATGKKLYIDLAINLARSFFHWHKNSTINFQIVTDQPNLLPLDINDKAEIIKISPGELGDGFSSKLHLDKLASEGQTLFIDSDCLIFENLESIFENFKGEKVSVIGGYISDGEWFGDIKSICKKFNIPHMPKFNGGIYYLEKGDIATKVYENARKIEQTYDEIGFVRLRGKPNDEVIMSLAMQLNNQQPISDDGSIMGDLQACRGKYEMNVINGKRLLTNPPSPSPLHQSWYPFTNTAPRIIHFLGYYTQHYPYSREAYRLKAAAVDSLNLFSEMNAKLFIDYPGRLKLAFKNTFRPIYHLFFPPRKVKVSQRG